MKKISTPLTMFSKFVFSTMWFLVIGVLAFHPDIREIPVIFILPFFVFWEYSRIKNVSIDSDYLYISNFLRTEKIPLENVDKITDNIWLQSHPVTIHLKEPCSWGNKIVFMPEMVFLFFQQHPIVKKLEEKLVQRKVKK